MPPFYYRWQVSHSPSTKAVTVAAHALSFLLTYCLVAEQCDRVREGKGMSVTTNIDSILFQCTGKSWQCDSEPLEYSPYFLQTELMFLVLHAIAIFSFTITIYTVCFEHCHVFVSSRTFPDLPF